ncbi:MAG: ADP-ribosylglycohydrolase family protein [Prevotellaceae bacterium]|jgi:ADP-ribosylglycohydrolase|nr:ADP-ribosylglycohydrolase family protein [Prevotellaceae bacterium]
MDRNKISGVLFGGAVGDALGLGTEFFSKEEVLKYYPDGLNDYAQIVGDRHRSRWQTGDWTDDTDQTLCIAKAIIKDRDIVPETVAQELYAWFGDCPMGVGRHTYEVLSLSDYLQYPEKVSKLIWELSHCKSAANGAVMRTSIIGLWNRDVEQKAEEVCKLTHYDPRCVGSCVIVSLLVNRLINNATISKDEIIQIGNRYDPRIQEYVELSDSSDICVLKLDDSDSIGYTLKTLSAGLWTYFNCKSFEEGLKAVIHEGGDADTNAAVACSILGAKFGYDSIPKHYIDGLMRKEYLSRTVEQLTAIISNEIGHFEN